MDSIEDSFLTVAGYRIRSMHYPTASGAAPLGSAVFVHGLGDHGARHSRVLSRFVERGIACTTVDLPGHGLSTEPRGYVSSLESIHQIIAEALRFARGRAEDDAPLGLLGHSMGGFLTLDYLSRHPDQCHFSWVSSPLIDARWNKSRWLRLTAHVLGIAAPRFAIHNGISNNACKRDPDRIRESQLDTLVHRRVTMRLGRILLKATKELPKVVENINPALRLLVTHGSEDKICPSHLSKALFDRLPLADKQYALLDGLLHEPFNDIGREAFFGALDGWLKALTASWQDKSAAA